MANDKPLEIEDQVDRMKKYVVFVKKGKMREFLQYTGYFRASRYGKYLLSFTNVFTMKPSQDVLYALYQFDFELRKILFEACTKAEVQLKTVLANAVSLKTKDAVFYLDRNNYTPSRGERAKIQRQKNIRFFENFYQDLTDRELRLRQDKLKYPELAEYRKGGKRVYKNVPCWAAFSYFEMGNIENIYMYLRSDLRKEILLYGYSRGKYGKKITEQMDTWINGVRTLRNICAHHARLVGMKEAIVLSDLEDDADVLLNGEDLFSRLYALKKILRPKDSENMKKQLKAAIYRTKINIYQLNILPVDWENRFDRINYL